MGKKASDSAAPKFGRFPDVQRQFGIKRGTCYNLIDAGEIKAKRVSVGGKRGIVLIDLQSVSNFIRRQPAAA